MNSWNNKKNKILKLFPEMIIEKDKSKMSEKELSKLGWGITYEGKAILCSGDCGSCIFHQYINCETGKLYWLKNNS